MLSDPNACHKNLKLRTSIYNRLRRSSCPIIRPSKYVCALYGNPSNVRTAMFHDLQHLSIPTELNFHSCDP